MLDNAALIRIHLENYMEAIGNTQEVFHQKHQYSFALIC